MHSRIDLEQVSSSAVDALRPFLPRLQIKVDELGQVPDEKLPGQGMVRLTLLLLKHGQGPEVMELLPHWADEFRVEVARGKPGLQNLTLLVTYLMTVNEHVTMDAVAEFLEPMGDAAKEIPMTVGEQLIEKGRREGEQMGLQKGLQKGLQEGRQEGELHAKRTLARKLLAKGSSPADVAELIELSLDEVQSLTH